jgi:hypothetical protein
MSLLSTMKNRDENLVEKIIRLMETDQSVDAPKDSIKWAKNIFRTRTVEIKKSVFQNILAVLKIDLSPNKAAFGERSASASQARQMLFSAGENGVDLRISEGEKGFTVRGQVLGEGFANCTIKLNDFQTVTNELSEFSFSNIPSGKYNLILQTDDIGIAIKDLDIK